MIIIDGTNAVLGRVASHAAKSALRGEDIAILNAEKMAITGDPKMVVGEYRRMRNIKDIANPLKGPFLPRRPDLFVKRSMQGMVPKRKRGKEALSRIKAYIGEPNEFKGKGKHMFECKSRFVTVGEVCRALGWNG
ncbi:50S ribosomal protein L13 [Candidatus Micrarchaeota archaeon]|nr:50S ribosomal protein L13 [Candidatus Micrarchaeota archaeon]